jgi:branched-chain amino acid transport system ATP-binding protein
VIVKGRVRAAGQLVNATMGAKILRLRSPDLIAPGPPPVREPSPDIDRQFVPTASILQVEDIDVSYGQVRALRGVTLRVGKGEMVAMVGANGAGKTTTLRAISGLMHPSRGRITFEGRAIHDMPAQDVVQLGVAHVPEGRDLFSSLTVTENLRLGYWTRRSHGDAFSGRLNDVMDYFPRLRERAHQAAGTLSGGEQQMLVIARALMSSPKLLVVDELSLGLAPIVVTDLFSILRAVNAGGTSVLLVEQFVHLALENTHRAYALAKGSIVAEGSSEDMAKDQTLVAAYLGGNDKP